MHERREFYGANRLQSTVFRIAAHLVKDAHQDANRQQLFPQVLRLVTECIGTRVDLSDEAVIEDVVLTKYQAEIAERIRTALRSVMQAGEPPILPVLDSYRPRGTTADAIFTTTRKVWPTTRSHVSHVVLESGWEKRAAQILESHRKVDASLWATLPPYRMRILRVAPPPRPTGEPSWFPKPLRQSM